MRKTVGGFKGKSVSLLRQTNIKKLCTEEERNQANQRKNKILKSFFYHKRTKKKLTVEYLEAPGHLG